MNRIAVVTGAGSGVGRAVALALALHDWRVALVGRRQQALEETIAMGRSSSFMAIACDVSQVSAVKKMAQQVLEDFGAVELLVNAAGSNVPARSLQELSLENYHRLLDSNLNGAYYCTQEFLPVMRRRKSGTIVNIISEAGKQASPKAGVAYVMSKFGLTGLTQSINAEERTNGIRACAIFPGDIDTSILDLRPAPPPPEARLRMLQAEDVAQCVLLVVNLPPRAMVEEILIRPR